MIGHSAPSDVELFDSHAHVDAPEFDDDRDAVLRRARAADITEMLVPAVAAHRWPALQRLCAQAPGLYPAYGLHPCYLDDHAPGDLDRLRRWLADHPAAAVGECGLDGSAPASARVQQADLLHAHLAIAHESDLPLVLHARRAFEDLILALHRFGKPLRGVVHSFSGSAEQARELWRLGFCVGIGGPVTYERARRLRRIVAAVPIDSLLLETDAPDQPGAAHCRHRNEPAFLVEVLACVASLRGTSPKELALATRDNARRLFAPRR